MDRDELIALAERLENACGPCMAVDADIELTTGNWSPEHYEVWHRFQECGEAANPPLAQPVGPNRYTASLDAALTLVPEGWQCDGLKWWEGEGASCDLVGSTIEGDQWVHRFNDGRVSACGQTPALALCAAALRAKTGAA